MGNTESKRLYYFDFARATFLIMGIFYHSAFVFSHKPWLVEPSKELSWVFDYIINFLREFRMEGFFFISGFFAMMTILKRGKDYFVVSRSIRLGVPLFFFGLTINLLCEVVYLGVDIHNSFNAVFNYFLGGSWLHHLWFLGVLIVMILLTWGAVVLVPSFPKVLERVKISYILFLIILTGMVFLSRHLGFRVLNSPFGGPWVFFVKGKFFYYFPFFVVGLILYLKQDLLRTFINNWGMNLMISIVQFIIIFGGLREVLNRYLIEVFFPIGAIATVGVWLFIFKKFFDRNSTLTQNVSEASYSIYLLHQPLIIVTAPLILKLDIGIGFEYIVFVSFVFVLSYFFHRLVIRKIPIFYFLMNGKWR
ncbi:acyltransferase family protein [Marinilabilia salmonicolor]|uniref:Surface polysaccharide O-acyltransferase-like enzyme n=1 Tax=Marinilabilia salmonicolor TaxID=989 RepID=A0A368V8S9_9BACT|nr:acyltransferase family protein [Marinilabilia salmonicolor]RCW35381.1 surface polysaccharide O-acyltransferase-like enzyme [Marinilabilia salmonicolor]